MKSISGPMAAHLQGELTTLATCWLVTRIDGRWFAYTDHDQPLTIGGITYQPNLSYTCTAIRTSSDLSVDNIEAQGVMDSSQITDADLRAGLFDHAAVQIFAVNWADLTMGIVKLRSGWLGKVAVTQNKYQAELRGLTQALQTKRGNCYSPTCRADLGDSKCQVNLGAITRSDISINAATKTLTTTAGNFIGNSSVPGYAVGQPLSLTGFDNPGNNSVQIVTALTATTLTFDGATGLVNEAAGAAVTITLAQTGTVSAVTSGRLFAASGLVGGAARNISYTASTISFLGAVSPGAALHNANVIQDTARGFVSAGFEVGDQISVSGSGDNDRLYTIVWIFSYDWLQQIQVEQSLMNENAGEPVTIATVNPDWFAFGLVTWLTGQNAGLTMEVRSWDGTNVNLFLPMPYTIQVGDTFSIVPGCDKRAPTCVSKFNNVFNFRGERDVPGQDAVLYYPDAH